MQDGEDEAGEQECHSRGPKMQKSGKGKNAKGKKP